MSSDSPQKINQINFGGVENVSTFAVPIKTGNNKKSLSAMLER
jgi:hypothetical protein